MARKKDEAHDPTLGPQITAVNIGGDSIVDRIAPHIKKIAVAIGVIVVILTVVFTYRWHKHSKQEDATNALVKGLDAAERPVMTLDIELPPELTKMQPASWKSYAERSEKGLAGLEQAGGARSAAALVEAKLLVSAGKLDQAAAIYRAHGGKQNEDGVLAREGLGIVLETQAMASKDAAQTQKLLEESLLAFRSMQPDAKGLRRDYALYHQGRVLESLRKPAEAIAELQRALTDVPDTELKSLIENRLAVLGAKPAAPAPAPAENPPAPVTPPAAPPAGATP